MQISHKISGVTGPKFTEFVAVVIFSLTLLTRQSGRANYDDLIVQRDLPQPKSAYCVVAIELIGQLDIAADIIGCSFV